MYEGHLASSSILSIPLELRNLIYLEVARTFVLNVSARDRMILLSDALIYNACCAMHSKKTASTATSLALVSHQIAAEARQIAFHRSTSPISVYFSSASTLSDFERHSHLYQPARLRDFCLSSVQNVMVKAPSAWLALPLPGECFKSLRCLKVAGIASNVHDIDVLRVSLRWNGWEKEERLSNGQTWVYLRVE